MATSSIWVNPTQITAGPGTEVDATGANSARVSARISTDPASILQFNPDGSLAAYEGGASNVVRQVPNNYDLTQYLGEHIVYRGALFKFVPDDPLFPTIGEYTQAGILILSTLPSTYVVDFIQVAGENYIWEAGSSSYELVGAHFFLPGDIPVVDVGPIQVIGQGWYTWVGTAGGIVYNKYINNYGVCSYTKQGDPAQTLPEAPSFVKIEYGFTSLASDGISLTSDGDIKVALPGMYEISGGIFCTNGTATTTRATFQLYCPSHTITISNLIDYPSYANEIRNAGFSIVVRIQPEDEAPYMYAYKTGAGTLGIGANTRIIIKRIGDL